MLVHSCIASHPAWPGVWVVGACIGQLRQGCACAAGEFSVLLLQHPQSSMAIGNLVPASWETLVLEASCWLARTDGMLLHAMNGVSKHVDTRRY